MARWQVKVQTFSRVRRKFFLAKVFFLRTHEGFAKNCILSCHLAIFLSLIPFLKGVGCNLKCSFCKSLVRRRAGKPDAERSCPPAYARFWNFILHPTPLRKGKRDTKMARWQLKMAFFANPSCVRRKKTFAKKNFLRTREKVWNFTCHLAILPS